MISARYTEYRSPSALGYRAVPRRGLAVDDDLHALGSDSVSHDPRERLARGRKKREKQRGYAGGENKDTLLHRGNGSGDRARLRRNSIRASHRFPATGIKPKNARRRACAYHAAHAKRQSTGAASELGSSAAPVGSFASLCSCSSGSQGFRAPGDNRVRLRRRSNDARRGFPHQFQPAQG
jgi:hypothetical protein